MASVLGRSKGVEAARGGATTTLLAWVIYMSCNMFSHFPFGKPYCPGQQLEGQEGTALA